MSAGSWPLDAAKAHQDLLAHFERGVSQGSGFRFPYFRVCSQVLRQECLALGLYEPDLILTSQNLALPQDSLGQSGEEPPADSQRERHLVPSPGGLSKRCTGAGAGARDTCTYNMGLQISIQDMYAPAVLHAHIVYSVLVRSC